MKFRSRMGLSLARCLAASTLAFVAASARADTLYVSQLFAGDIVAYDTSASSPSPTTVTSATPDPSAMTFDAAGNLYVAVQATGGTEILEVTPGRAVSTYATLQTGAILGLAFDSSGNLYATDDTTLGTGAVEKIAPGGAVSTYASNLASPSGLAIDSAGNLFVSTGTTITEISPGGAKSTYATGLSNALSLAFDAAGHLYAVDNGNGQIDKFTPSGMSVVASGFHNPNGLAIDSSGNLFVTAGSNPSSIDSIYRVTQGGTTSIFVTGLATYPYDLAFGPAIASVPEPSSVVMMAIAGLAGAVVLARRRLEVRVRD